jgi:hypothetical protein
MPVKDPALISIVHKIGEHYRNNIDSRFVRDSITRLRLDRGDWDHINVITELPEYIRLQGFEYYDLYEKILAIARLVKQIQTEILPNLSFSRTSRGNQEEILRSMALSNYGSNVSILADLINELYIKTVDLDKQDNGLDPVHTHIPELQNLGNMLINRNS